MMKIKSKNKGFTLIELLIYTTIFALTAGVLTTILITTTRVENVEIVNNQVGQELNLVLETVQRLVRDSSLIECVGADQANCSLSTTSGSFLRLRFQDPTGGTKDPKCIYLDNGVIKLAEGEDPGPPVKKEYCNTATATNLTTDKVTANSLTFTKFDIPGGHATVQIDATLAYISTNPELQISKTLKSAVGRVSAATFDSNLLPNVNNLWDIGSITGPSYKWKNVYISNLLGLGTNTGDPAGIPGAIYFNTTGNNVKVYNGTSWKNVGFNGTLSSALTGTVSVTIGTAAVTGVGTLFTSELVVGDSIKIGSEIFTVSAITDNFNLTLDSNHIAGASGLTAYRDPDLFIIDNGDSINKLTITKSGNVGIGTASPNSRLEVNPTVTATTNYTGIKSGLVYNGVTPMANWYGAYITSPTGTGAITNKYALIAEASAGNVGIGTTSPGELLSLGLAGTTKGVLSLAGNALGAGKITIQPAANTGTYALTLPTGTGSLGQFLQTDGAGVTSWAVPGGGSKFGGDGTDGACCTGAVPVNLGGAAVFVKNYTSISITGTDQLIFTNPHANGTVIFLRSQGNVTITSTASPAIELTGIGGIGGASVVGNSGGANGGRGTFIRGATEGYGGGGGYGGASPEGSGGVVNNTEFYSKTAGSLNTRNILVAAGSGGGSGGAAGGSNSGAGGRGGGSLYIESGGYLNFTGVIWSKGGAGVVGEDWGGGNCGGSGGGGSGGQILVIYNFLTANSGTITATNGLGGVGNGCGGAKGGGGGGSPFANGSNGSASAGGAGGAGGSLIVKNDWF